MTENSLHSTAITVNVEHRFQIDDVVETGRERPRLGTLPADIGRLIGGDPLPEAAGPSRWRIVDVRLAEPGVNGSPPMYEIVADNASARTRYIIDHPLIDPAETDYRGMIPVDWTDSNGTWVGRYVDNEFIPAGKTETVAS